MDILIKIQTRYPELTVKERLVADYIFKNSQQIKNMNISVLASTVGVSDGMITRFCKKIGCKSYADLKVQISGLPSVQNTDENTVHSMIYEYYRVVIDQTNQLVHLDTLSSLVKKIQGATRIYLYGVGSSGLTATEFSIRLTRMGLTSQQVTDGHMMMINSSILNENDLVLAFSISGETPDILAAVSLAKQNKCHCAAFTCFPTSSLAKQCDRIVGVANPLFLNKERFINSQFSAMYITDLISEMLLKNKQLNENMNITIDTILKKRIV